MISEYIQKIKSGKVDIDLYVKESITKFKELNEKYSCFSIISEDVANECKEHLKKAIENGSVKDMKLAGVFVSIKDCVCVKGVETTSSSRILKGYEPVFDAYVVKKLKKEGAIIVGKTIQDEFGFGSFCTNVGLEYPIPKNPFDTNRVAGGSSGGCAVATQLAIMNDIPHISIAESTGGSIENPASFCGVIGFCPTYGRVSRNGLLSYANSLDKIGIMAEKIDDVSTSFEVIAGKDDKESTSIKDSEYHRNITEKKFKIGIIKESMNKDVSEEVLDSMQKMIAELKKEYEIEEVSLPFTFEFGIPAYYILAMSEASTNLSCLCGLRYGKQDVKKDEHFSQYFKIIRSEHFGKEAKRRIMLGTFTRMAGYRDAFYIRAAKARTKVIEEYKRLFEKYDILISPTMPFTAPQFEDIQKLKPIDHYMADIMTVGPNLAGIPHMSFPIGKDKEGMPIGIMVNADHHKEDVLFSFGNIVEKLQEENKDE